MPRLSSALLPGALASLILGSAGAVEANEDAALAELNFGPAVAVGELARVRAMAGPSEPPTADLGSRARLESASLDSNLSATAPPQPKRDPQAARERALAMLAALGLDIEELKALADNITKGTPLDSPFTLQIETTVSNVSPPSAATVGQPTIEVRQASTSRVVTPD